MATKLAPWRTYQQAAAALFRQLGCGVQVDAVVDGARSTHRVDVWVTFHHWGVAHVWLVECKRHAAPVKKRDVETLKSIAADVGADRAILLSESGFQPSAVTAVRKTNITLSSLETLRRNARDEVLRSLLDKAEGIAADLQARIANLYVVTEVGPGSHTSRPRPGVDAGGIYKTGMIGMLLSAAQGARAERFPVPVPNLRDETEIALAPSLGDLLNVAFPCLANIERWVAKQEQGVAAAGGDAA